MKASYIKMTEEVNSETKEWLLSNKIMNDMVEKYKLAKYIKGGLSNNDDWIEIQRILYAGKLPSSNWKFIHWMNEEWRYREIDKSAYYRNSFLGKLYHQYNIPCTSCKVPIKTNLMYRLKEIYRFGTTQIKSILK